jgi:hypothetical protein
MTTGKLYNIGFLSSNTISGGSITTSDFSLIANTISGLIDPIWPSAAANKHYVDSIQTSGWDTITDNDTIAHGLVGIPKYVNIVPSGSMSTYGISTRVDDTYIYVNLTAFGSRDVFWYANL